MVIGQCNVHHWANDDLKLCNFHHPLIDCLNSSAYLSFDSNGSLKCSVHSQNCALGWIDDWRSQQRSKHSSIADREGAAVHILDCQRSFLGLVAKRVDAQLYLCEVHAFAAAQHWHNETFRGSNSHRDINVIAINNFLEINKAFECCLIKRNDELTLSSMTALTVG